MSWLRMFTRASVVLGCLGIVLPEPLLRAAWSAPPAPAKSPGAVTTARLPAIGDVELDRGGALRGVVVNVQGVPIAGATIVISKDGREVARTTTDEAGCFSAAGLGGGLHQVTAGDYAILVRAWPMGTAPPKTRPLALMVVGSDVVRGQRPISEFFTNECVLLVALAAAMIAIPIAVYQSQHHAAHSP